MTFFLNLAIEHYQFILGDVFMELKVKELYEEWLNNATDDSNLTTELESIKNDEDAIYDRFYRMTERIR